MTAKLSTNKLKAAIFNEVYRILKIGAEKNKIDTAKLCTEDLIRDIKDTLYTISKALDTYHDSNNCFVCRKQKAYDKPFIIDDNAVLKLLDACNPENARFDLIVHAIWEVIRNNSLRYYFCEFYGSTGSVEKIKFLAINDEDAMDKIFAMYPELKETEGEDIKSLLSIYEFNGNKEEFIYKNMEGNKNE